MSAPRSIVTRLSAEQTVQLHGLYQGEWWTAGRSLAEVRTMLQHSDFIFAIVADDSPRLLAFARVLTDRVFKAFIFDVIVHPDYRGAGLGRSLMEHLLAHPVLAQVRHLELYGLPERREFYRRLGFSPDLGELQLMRRTISLSTAENP